MKHLGESSEFIRYWDRSLSEKDDDYEDTKAYSLNHPTLGEISYLAMKSAIRQKKR